LRWLCRDHRMPRRWATSTVRCVGIGGCHPRPRQTEDSGLSRHQVLAHPDF
jgi:hypothetical protein